MTTLSLAVASGQSVLASPTMVVSGSASSTHIPWTSGANISPGEPQPTIGIESPVLSAVAPTPSSHHPWFIANAAMEPQPTTQIFTLTVTQTLTITVPASTSTSTTSPPAPPPSKGIKRAATEWKNPKKMDDLSAFNISRFSGGRDNLEIIQGIPASIASASVSSTASSDFASDLESDNGDVFLASRRKSRTRTTWKDDESSIQLLYPAGSVNPAQRPVGGAQFYGLPLDLTNAANVSLGYSVFFPETFDWVLGGKMPGLYGGHGGCSGGNAALDCWSTRLMWRKDGEGELYLYAPKDKQTAELCNDPQSVCDAAYGFSIGRGAFNWRAGRWTTVLQTVTLNTPGKQDGWFTLDVNGKRVLERKDVFYRDVPPGKDHTTTTDRGVGLGDLLGPLLGGLIGRGAETERVVPTSTATGDNVVQPMHIYEAQQAWAIQTTPGEGGGDSEATPTAGMADDPEPTEPPDISVQANGDGGPVGFRGLFFSSFFGGHEARYATPTDQYVWFKDFSMSNNS